MSRVEILNLVFGNFLVYSTVPNKRGPNSRGWEKSWKFNKRGVQISGGGGFGNPYLKIRYKIMFFIPKALLPYVYTFI